VSEGSRPDSAPTLADELPAVVASGDALLDNLTPAEKEYLRSTLPTEEEVMLGWATPVLAAPAAARLTLVASQIAVLRGLWDDPAGWCSQALKLAAEEVRGRGEHDG